jgi:glycosyltransferase involved in cell wall biosynthesis
MAKTKVLHIVKSLDRGGAEILLLETLKFHNKEEFDFFYIYFLSWKNKLVKEIEEQGGRVINLSSNNNIHILFQIFKLRKFIKNNQIQITHCHLPWTGIVGRIVGKISHTPVIYSEHNKQERYHFITRFLNKITYNWQNLAIAVSEDVKNSIDQNINTKSKVEVVYNGVNTVSFNRIVDVKWQLRRDFKILDTTIVLGNICVFRKQKRLDKWVDLFENINKQYPDSIGLLVGAGILFDEIKTYIKDRNLEDKILLVGLQTDVKQYLNIIDIFISTSEFEGLPIALLEAMSMQCAVAVTNAGGVKEVIDNSVNGFMVDVKRIDLLENIVLKLINDIELRQVMGLNARNTVEEKFSIKATTQQIENCYNKILTIK